MSNDAQYLHVYENGTEGEITDFSLNSDRTVATLTVSFTGSTTAPYTYTAKYAKTLSGSKNPLILNEQNPGTASFDPAADVLVSKATDNVTNLTERATKFTFTMGRVVTVNKMTLTGLEAGEVISSVEFTLDKHMAGYVSYDAENNIYTYSNGGTKLTLNYTATSGVVPTNGQFPVYFVSAPVDAAGIVSVVVTTDKNVYTKSSSLNPNTFGKTITFAIGTMKRFTMAMSGYGEAISTGTDYTLVESQSNLFDGASYIIVGNADDLVAMGTQNSNNRASVGVTASSKVINIDNTIAAATFTIEKVSKGYTILDNSTSKYLYTGSTSANRLQSTDTANDNATWNISISDGVATITNVGNTSRGVMCLNGDLFNCYASLGSYKTLSLYVDLDTCIPTLATPSILAEVQNANEIYVTWDEVANADGYTVTCTGQSAQNISTGVGEATFTGLTDGTYTVTVTAISNDHTSYLDSQAATVEDLLIGSPKGTVDNPYTVAEAIALFDGTLPTAEVYVKGKVSNVVSFNSKYGSITYYISDDGNRTNELYVYGGLSLNESQFTEKEDLAVNDEVLVCGKLKLYSGTKEFDSNNYLISLNGKSKILSAPTVSAEQVGNAKQVKVDWNAVDEATSYVVECGVDTYIATASETSHTFDVASYTTYSVKVTAKADDAIDGVSASVSVSVAAPALDAAVKSGETATDIPAAGATRHITVTGNVAWTASITNGATVSPATGTGASEITVTIPANTDTENGADYVFSISTEVAGVTSPDDITFSQVKKTNGGTYSMTPDGDSTGSTATKYITTLTEFTYEGITWKMNQWNPSTLQIKTNESSATSEFRFYNTSAFSGRISRVVIKFSSLTVSDASKLMFLGGTSVVTSTSGGTAGTWDSSTKTLTWTPGASDNFTYFAFYQNGKAASGTNKLATADAIEVTYE